jgi:hypothetical protein
MPTGPATHGRDLRIDSIRGLALCWITVSHLDFGTTSWTWDTAGHSSFAEVFVFISGLVAGIVYWKTFDRSSARAIRAKAFARARQIYFTYLGVVVFIVAFVHGVNALGIHFTPWGSGLLRSDPWTALMLAPVFVYQPGFSNILPMYCIFMLLLPFAIEQIAAGRENAVLAASVVGWWAAQNGAYRMVLGPITRAFETRIPFFDPLAWQLLFVFGVWFGTRRASGRPVALPESRAFVWTLAALLLMSFGIRHGIFLDDGAAELLERITQRHDLDPLRIANFAALAYLTARIAERHPSWFEWRWLAFLGQHSLQVFAFSIGASYVARLVGRDLDPPGQWLVAAIAAASLTIPAWAHLRYRRLRSLRPATASKTSPA